MKNKFLVFALFFGLPIVAGVIIYNAIFKASNDTSLPVSSTSTTKSVSNSKNTVTVKPQMSSVKAVKSSRVS